MVLACFFVCLFMFVCYVLERNYVVTEVKHRGVIMAVCDWFGKKCVPVLPKDVGPFLRSGCSLWLEVSPDHLNSLQI